MSPHARSRRHEMHEPFCKTQTEQYSLMESLVARGAVLERLSVAVGANSDLIELLKDRMEQQKRLRLRRQQRRWGRSWQRPRHDQTRGSSR